MAYIVMAAMPDIDCCLRFSYGLYSYGCHARYRLPPTLVMAYIFVAAMPDIDCRLHFQPQLFIKSIFHDCHCTTDSVKNEDKERDGSGSGGDSAGSAGSAGRLA